jgi:hypothetical protein
VKLEGLGIPSYRSFSLVELEAATRNFDRTLDPSFRFLLTTDRTLDLGFRFLLTSDRTLFVWMQIEHMVFYFA